MQGQKESGNAVRQMQQLKTNDYPLATLAVAVRAYERQYLTMTGDADDASFDC